MLSSWEFDEKITPVFDEHVREHVPLYEEIHDMVKSLAGWYLEDDSIVYDIGTSTGEVIFNLKNTYTNKKLKYYGIDLSTEMINKASKRFKNDANITIIEGDVSNNEISIENASLITSILTIMFTPPKTRQSIIRKIYDGMNKGAAFIMVEKIVGNNARFDEMWIELYHDMKYKNGVDGEGIYNKSRAIRGVLRPYTVTENEEMLKEAGFKDVDMFFKWGNFVGFIATK